MIYVFLPQNRCHAGICQDQNHDCCHAWEFSVFSFSIFRRMPGTESKMMNAVGKRGLTAMEKLKDPVKLAAFKQLQKEHF